MTHKTQSHFNLTDIEFEQQFASCALDPSIFDHEAHLRLAYIHIKKYGEEMARGNLCNQLVAFVDHLGVAEKYNTTLTIAAIKAVHHFMKKTTATDFKGLLIEFPRLKNDFKGLMAAHYGFDIYTSKKAKRTFLAPDLIPFD